MESAYYDGIISSHIRKLQSRLQHSLILFSVSLHLTPSHIGGLEPSVPMNFQVSYCMIVPYNTCQTTALYNYIWNVSVGLEDDRISST